MMRCLIKFNFALFAALLVPVVEAEIVETGWFSEEGAAQGNCPTRGNSQSILKGLFCSGRYCDNIKLQCTYEEGVTRGYEHRTAYFSEGDRLRECPDTPQISVIVGMSCRGSYCDDLSLRCLRVDRSLFVKSRSNCDDTDWFSEEYGGHKIIPSHSYPVGLGCRRSYCDEKMIRYCYESGYGPNSGWFSEENNGEGICPVKDGYQTMLRGLSCSGAYCDNLKVHCASMGAVRVLRSYWSEWFSEEATQQAGGAQGLRKCVPGHVITGIRCRGAYCDDLSMQCKQIASDVPLVNENNCGYTGWFSEESEGYAEIPDNAYPIGIRCRGAYCDDKEIHYCFKHD